jgi:hypothetical protein
VTGELRAWQAATLGASPSESGKPRPRPLKVEQRLGHEPFIRGLRLELLAALIAVADAWEEHIIRARAWAAA